MAAEFRYDHAGLCLVPDRMLEDLLRGGTAPSFESLAGWEFDGYNTADLTGLANMHKFRKGYYRDPRLPEGEIGGYNVDMKQGRPNQPWEVKLHGGKPKRHSHFRVYPVRDAEADSLYPNALLLNYDFPGTPFWNPARLLRDYLVQVYPENPDLLLGKAYFALPGGRRFVSFFVLKRAERG
jgi:hypothetical protein